MMEGVEKQESNAEEVSALAWLWVIGPVVRGGGERWVTVVLALFHLAGCSCRRRR